MSIFPAGYLNSHKDDADDAIDTDKCLSYFAYKNVSTLSFMTVRLVCGKKLFIKNSIDR